ncbi:MAG: hypothetical protein ACI9EW_001913, partial [Cellvibrionaceae bacterium]
MRSVDIEEKCFMKTIQTKTNQNNHRRTFIKGIGLSATAGVVTSLTKQVPNLSAAVQSNEIDDAYDIEAITWSPSLPSAAVV